MAQREINPDLILLNQMIQDCLKDDSNDSDVSFLEAMAEMEIENEIQIRAVQEYNDHKRAADIQRFIDEQTIPPKKLTVGDVKEIEKFLEMQKAASDNTAVKDKIDELIKKLDEMEIRS